MEIVQAPKDEYSIIVIGAKHIGQSYFTMILSKWLRSLRYGNPLLKKIDSDQYYEHYHTYIENLLEKPDSKVRFASLSDDHDCVLGFSVHREDVLDYIWVHRDYRRLGIGKLLLPKDITTFTHVTLTGMTIWQTHYPTWKFNPFA